MKFVVIIVWTVFFVLSTVAFIVLVKRRKRKLKKLDFFIPFIFGILSFVLGYVYFLSWIPEVHQIWAIRFTLLGLGIFITVTVLKRGWVIRDIYRFPEDSILLESLYVFATALLCSVLFSGGGFLSLFMQSIDLDPSKAYWDIPLFIILPFFWSKLFDMVGHRSPKTLKGQWAFPLEPVSAQNWPWRDLMIVNFEMKRSLLEEYDIYAEESQPWIEAPQEISLGSIFHLCLQERRNNKALNTIQDLGDEYDGSPQFYWMFLRKCIWYKPRTWKKEMRYLNPELSIKANKILKDDIIVARRIPDHGLQFTLTEDEPDIDEDSNKTVIIRR